MDSNGFLGWYLAPLKSFAKFVGRTRRREYWTFVIVNAVVGGLLSAFGDWSINLGFLSGTFACLVFVPTFAAVVRRLHDVGKDGVFLLWGLLPVIGWIVLFITLIKDSDPGNNSFGSSPKDTE